MKGEAVRKIRDAMVPRVTFESARDVPDGIDFKLRLEYDLPRRIVKTITGTADKDGNILSWKGLF